MDRLDKFLAAWGGLTRSQAKEALKEGRVTVDGIPERDGARKVDAARTVALDGRALARQEGPVVLMLHKPAGFVTSTQDPRGRTVMELLPQEYRNRGINPVGRLDKDTEGLLLFTDDGALAHKLIAPRHAVEKIYYARHEGQAGQADALAFASGLTLRDGTLCRPAKLEPLGPGESRITVQEGKYHQVRRMMAARGMTVLYLKRIAEGPLSLGDLPLGQVRRLTEAEIRDLTGTEKGGEVRPLGK